MKRLRELLIRQYHGLMQIRDTPHALAGGVAIGLIMGFTPLLGVKTLVAVLLAWIFRCSKLSAALAVAFHDVLWPIWPVVLRWEFQIGFYLLSKPHHLPPKLSAKHLHMDDLFHMKTLWLLWPTLVGSLIISIPIGIIFYFIVLSVAKHYPGRKDVPVTYS